MESANSADAIGIVGLGIMGGALARNLIASGHVVFGYDVDATRAAELSAIGVNAVRDVSEMAGHVGMVLACLPHPAALDATASGLVAGRSSGHALIVVEASTLAIEDKFRARDLLVTRGITLLDCPLSGTGAQAAVGDLSIFGSGNRAAFDRCVSMFRSIAKRTYYVGEFGNGMKMKLVANLLVAIHNVAAAEGISLGLRAGLDPETLVAIVGSGAAGSRMLELRGPMMVSDSFLPASAKLSLWLKDLDLIAELATRYGVSTPLFSATLPLYSAAVSRGMGELDTAAVFRVLEKVPRDA